MLGPIAAVAILTHPNPGRSFSTHRPTDCFAIVHPRRAVFPGGDGETIVTSASEVARLVSNVRASTRTAHSVDIRSVLCGRWASTRNHRAASPLSFQASLFSSSRDEG